MHAALLEAVEAIRPALQSDGGDMVVLKLDEEAGVVDIELVGACDGCPMSSMTLKAGIERILKDRVPGLKEVRAKGIDFDTVEDGFDSPPAAAAPPYSSEPLPEGSASFS